MSLRPEVVELTRQWIEKAEEDLLNAEHTLTLGDACPVGTVCFHAQQCVEKYLKALLTCREIPFPKTHDLIVLFNRLGGESGLSLGVELFHPMNRYSTETRYPGDWEPIGMKEAVEAVETAKRVREAVRNVLPRGVLEGDRG